MVWAFSGHRPHRLPWGFREEDPRCRALKARLAEALAQILAAGPAVLLCGMARGCDTYFAEAALALLAADCRSELWAVLPCAGQADGWPAADRRRYRALCRASSRVLLLQEAYSEGCMLRRNRWMLDHADRLLTVYDGGGGGTGWMVREAARRGLPTVALWR